MDGASQEGSEELALCERFLELARSGDRGSDFCAALEGIYPLVLRGVEKVFSKWKGLSPGFMEARDVAHEVILRLQNCPPNREPGHNARFTVLNWIRTCTLNYLKDLSRKPSYKTVNVSSGQLEEILDVRRGRETDPSDAGGPQEPEENIYVHQHLAGLERFLCCHYPPGARYLEAQLSHPGATTQELARVLGTTRQNVYQIRNRLKSWIVRWRCGISS